MKQSSVSSFLFMAAILILSWVTLRLGNRIEKLEQHQPVSEIRKFGK